MHTCQSVIKSYQCLVGNICSVNALQGARHGATLVIRQVQVEQGQPYINADGGTLWVPADSCECPTSLHYRRWKWGSRTFNISAAASMHSWVSNELGFQLLYLVTVLLPPASLRGSPAGSLRSEDTGRTAGLAVAHQQGQAPLHFCGCARSGG